MSIAIQRSKTKVNKHILPVLEWAENLHAAAFIRLRYSLCAISETVQQQRR